MPCKRCLERVKDWTGEDPRCAFENGETASDSNWNCATVNELWNLARLKDSIAYGEDCTAALIPIYGTGDRFIVMSAYKRRGQADCLQVITGDGELVNLALETAEYVLGEVAVTEKPLPPVSYAEFIPANAENAKWWLARMERSGGPLNRLTREEFMRTWCAVVYMNPGRHPDDCDEWPEAIQKYAIEAFRRRNCGELEEHELYPANVIHKSLKDMQGEHGRG